MLTTILGAVLVLGVLILVHELGHFWAAKAVDVRVPRFSIGLGPKAFGFRRGETEYVVSWFPLGGYVKMAGMGEEEALEGLEGGAGEDEPTGDRPDAPEDAGREPSDRDFDQKPLWARTVVISAGVAMNFLFAVAAFAVIAGVWGVEQEVEARVGEVVEEALPGEALALARLPAGARIDSVEGEPVGSMQELRRTLLMSGSGPVRLSLSGDGSLTFDLPEGDSARTAVASSLQPPFGARPLVGSVEEGGPAAAAGLRAGDLVLRAGGERVESWQAFKQVVERHPGTTLPVEVERGGDTVRLEVVPAERTLAGPSDTLRYGRIAAALDEEVSRGVLTGLSRRRVGPLAAAASGLEETWGWTVFTVEVAVGLITGDVPGSTLAGPVRIVQYSGEVARMGGLALLRFMAILSVNLAILNLLPIPVLDGGHLMFLGAEALKGEAVSVETRIRWTQVGMLIVVGLMVWAIGNDLLQLFG